MNREDLIHVTNWPQYLHYVREDKIKNTPHWRPGQINIFVADTLDRLDGLSHADAGVFLRVLLAYASAPLVDSVGSALGLRRLSVRSALGVTHNPHAKDALQRLEQRGLVTFGPSQDRPVLLRGVKSSGVKFSGVESSAEDQVLKDHYDSTRRVMDGER